MVDVAELGGRVVVDWGHVADEEAPKKSKFIDYGYFYSETR
ncbi:hypothetical protein ANO14919_109620 [Xylariales sp. No.14919]|nr:hypothetical protein ANO14919_109620 [Xylariales sp. No.14919]